MSGTDPISDAIRQQAYEEALRELPGYVAKRWSELPKTMISQAALVWVAYQKLSPDQQLFVFLDLYRRSTVLAIDRANQIADSQSVAIMAMERPAA